MTDQSVNTPTVSLRATKTAEPMHVPDPSSPYGWGSLLCRALLCWSEEFARAGMTLNRSLNMARGNDRERQSRRGCYRDRGRLRLPNYRSPA